MAKTFNGTTDKIAGTITAADTGDWTQGSWIRPVTPGEANSGKIMWLHTSVISVIQDVGVGDGSSPTNLPMFARQVFSTTNASALSSTLLTASSYSCVFATFTSSDKTVRLYYGTLTAAMAEMAYSSQTVGVGTRTTGAIDAVIGNSANSDRAFDGRIERVFFEPRLWTLAEMEKFRLGWQPVSRPATPLRFYLPLNSQTASVAQDWSPTPAAWTVTGTTVSEGPSRPWRW